MHKVLFSMKWYAWVWKPSFSETRRGRWVLRLSLVHTQTMSWDILWQLFSKDFAGNGYNAIFGQVPLTKLSSRSKCNCQQQIHFSDDHKITMWFHMVHHTAKKFTGAHVSISPFLSCEGQWCSMGLALGSTATEMSSYDSTLTFLQGLHLPSLASYSQYTTFHFILSTLQFFNNP